MSRNLWILPGLTFLAFSALLAASPAEPVIKESSPGLLKKASYPGAKALAQVHQLIPSGTIEEAEIEEEKGQLIYSFDVRIKDKAGIDEVNISAISGSIISHDHEWPRQVAAEKEADRRTANAQVVVVESVPGLRAKASFPSAKAIAVIESLVPRGSILSATLEQEGSVVLYAFDVSVAGRPGIEDIDVSATSGKVLHHEHLSPKQYAKEKLADEKAAAAQKAKVAP